MNFLKFFIEGFILSLIEGFMIFKNGIENWFSVALNMFLLKRDVTCRIKNIGSVKLKKGKNYLNSSLFRALVFSNSKDLSQDHYDLLKSYLPQIDDEIITIINFEDKKEYKFLNKEVSVIFESFLFGEYDYIPYSGDGQKSLIDIGGNVADTAIYFANKGYDVIAFEPLPHIYEIAIKNISLNTSVKEKIIFVNKAVSCQNGTITINFNENDTAGAGEYTMANQQVTVETITINDIIEEYDIQPNTLKIDCEGCEVNIIKYSDLSMFKQIIMEYHTNNTGVDENILIDCLVNQGFELKNKRKSKKKGFGIIYMVKK